MDFLGYLIVFALVYWFLLRPIIAGFKEEISDAPFSQVKQQPTSYTWPELGLFEFEVVGESHYQQALSRIAQSSVDRTVVAVLIPEDQNKYDKNAVRVDVDGMTVGYLSREDAKSFRRRLSQKQLSGKATLCGAQIYGGPLPEKSFGIWLDIKPFEG
ncbi:MAG: HIRAN domain-containing protein [Rhodocyclaceae bacterium]|nr:HIRAN domain-containing protein [Rhodocyclaceae bacterium]